MSTVRRKSLAIAALLGLGLAAAIVIYPKVLSHDRPPPATVDRCDLGRQNAFGVAGHDGAYSLILPDGRRFWSFDDTWIGKIENGRRTIDSGLHSTGAIQQDPDLCSAFQYLTDESGKVRQLIPGSPDPLDIHWPLASVLIGDRVYLYYERVRENTKPVLEINFDVLGVGLASADAASLVFKLENNGELLFPESEHGFADAVYSDGRYVYGLGCPPIAGSLEKPCRAARVPAGRIADRAAYQYWDGDFWQDDLARAVIVLDSGSSEMTLTLYRGKFLLVYAPPFSCDFYARKSPSITGPWSAPMRIYQAKVPPSAFCYAAKLQRISPDGQWWEMTWLSNGPLELHVSDPGLYWPHVVRIHAPDLLR
jgi:hypothetical protein